MFTENLVGLSFLQSVSYIKPIPTQEILSSVGKSGPNSTFDPNTAVDLAFLGWVGLGLGTSSVS